MSETSTSEVTSEATVTSETNLAITSSSMAASMKQVSTYLRSNNQQFQIFLHNSDRRRSEAAAKR